MNDNLNKLPNPLDEIEESVGEHTEEVGPIDEFEMNQAEKTETLWEYPANEQYDGPEPKPVDEREEKKEQN